MHKIYLLLAVFLAPISVFALNVDVIATPPSGTYHAPVRITLTPTDPRAKTFYSFKPDGYPQDAFLYTGSILIKHSTPLVYFSFLSTSNESKIKQSDYVIDYQSTVSFEKETVSGSWRMDVTIVNSGSENVDIGFWYVQSESDMVVIPEGTLLAPWATYSIGLYYPGTSSVVLRSPDDDERDILVWQSSPETGIMIPPKKKSIITRIVPRKIISIGETAPASVPTISATDVPAEQVSSQSTSPEGKAPLSTPSVSAIPNPSPPDINQIMKASANESGQKNMNPLYLVLLWGLSFGAGTIQWYMRRRQK